MQIEMTYIYNSEEIAVAILVMHTRIAGQAPNGYKWVGDKRWNGYHFTLEKILEPIVDELLGTPFDGPVVEDFKLIPQADVLDSLNQNSIKK